MPQKVIRHLRPHLFFSYRRSLPTSQTTVSLSRLESHVSINQKSTAHDYDKRISQLGSCKGLANCYPRLAPRFQQKQKNGLERLNAVERLQPGETLRSDRSEPICIAGRVQAVRTAGSKLTFYDIVLGDNGSGNLHKVQAVCQYKELEAAGVGHDQFIELTKTIRKGDWLSLTGWPHRTARGEVSMLLVQPPELLSPSLHQLPERLHDPETRIKKRHVDMIVNPQVVQSLRVRHEVEAAFHSFFGDQGFTKVTTPVISASAGGAMARPFETRATEFQNQPLHLRIAPELWLKRLVVGGLERVYEIGPVFRNEGVDATHNPEFYMCEFYEAFSTLEDLMDKTEALFDNLKRTVKSGSPSQALNADGPFPRIKFLPGLEQMLGHRMPDLSQPAALDDVKAILERNNISVPSRATLPALLDALAAQYLEPRCQNPTFITHHPACMSPLSKHFTCPETGQVVAARAELFIDRREIANMYEEENSPFEQRRKLEDQAAQQQPQQALEKGDGETDEGYIEALEWGLPPTGGWGCGMDRLVMLFSGQDRMADVLSFGTLRNVVGVAKR